MFGNICRAANGKDKASLFHLPIGGFLTSSELRSHLGCKEFKNISIDLCVSLLLLVPVVATGGILEGQDSGRSVVKYLQFCPSTRKADFNLYLFSVSKAEHLFLFLRTISISSSKNFFVTACLFFFSIRSLVFFSPFRNSVILPILDFCLCL